MMVLSERKTTKNCSSSSSRRHYRNLRHPSTCMHPQDMGRFASGKPLLQKLKAGVDSSREASSEGIRQQWSITLMSYIIVASSVQGATLALLQANIPSIVVEGPLYLSAQLMNF